jgi:hypothetical protein
VGTEPVSAWRLLIALSGLIVWSIAFVVLYAGLSLGCEAGLQLRPFAWTNMLTIVLGALWAIHLGALGALQWYALRLWHVGPEAESGVGRFLAAATCLIAATGLISTLVIGLPIVILPPCTRIPLWL